MMSFYENRCKALGMVVKRKARGVGPVLGVVATDSQRSLMIYPNGSSMLSIGLVEPPGLGVTIEVEYAPCASIVSGKVVISPRVSDTNMDAAAVPCSVPK